MEAAAFPWWIWPLSLFAVTFLLGIVAVLAGVGGGVLFVPIVGGFFPFHLDFVRAAGLLLALSGALSAGPALLRGGLASLRLAMPLALVGSITSIGGALLGLALPTAFVQSALGVTILAHDETVRGDTTMQTLAALSPSFQQMGEMAFDDVV